MLTREWLCACEQDYQVSPAIDKQRMCALSLAFLQMGDMQRQIAEANEKLETVTA